MRIVPSSELVNIAQLADITSLKRNVIEKHVCLELNTEKEGCMSFTAPECAQRPRAVYDIHTDF